MIGKCNGVLSITPTETPYFEPKRIQFRSFDCMGQTLEHLDFRIGAVTVGGSPQLAINNLTPSEDSSFSGSSISSKDLDKVNWSVFSTVGLARELQISVYNPHEDDLLIYACVEGEDVPSLDCYTDYPCMPSSKEMEGASGEARREELKKEIAKARAEEEERQREVSDGRARRRSIKEEKWREAEGGLQQVGSPVATLAPRERKLVQVMPSVSPYFKPYGARYHCHRVSDGAEVPVIVVDTICGRQLMTGGLFSSFEELLSGSGQPWIEDGPYEALDRVRKYIGLMEHEGISGINREKLRQIRQAPLSEIQGIPSTLLEKSHAFDNWHEIFDYPVFSTTGLARRFFALLYNPWPFSVRASVTVCGQAMSSLEPCDEV